MTSISISSTVVVTLGSLIELFEIKMFVVGSEGLGGEKKFTAKASVPYNELHFTIRDLQPATIYQVQVQAKNKAGFSDPSELSAKIEIGNPTFYQDDLVPAVETLEAIAITPTSISVNISSFETVKPRILGFKLFWSLEQTMNPLAGSSDLIKSNSYKIDNLNRGLFLVN